MSLTFCGSNIQLKWVNKYIYNFFKKWTAWLSRRRLHTLLINVHTVCILSTFYQYFTIMAEYIARSV